MDILIYGEINAALALLLANNLANKPDAPVTVKINSYGGSPLDATAIYNSLKSHRGKVTIHIEGICASAASLIAMAGRCVMAENALLMLHGPSVAIGGNAPALRENAATLDKVAESMLAIYTAKTRRPAAEIRKLLADGQDHWFNAAEALAFGLIDEIARPLRIAARLGTLKIPERFKTMIEATNALDPGAIEAAAIQAERARVSEINALIHPFLKIHPEQRGAFTALRDQLVTSGASVENARQQFLDALGAASPGPLAAGQGCNPTLGGSMSGSSYFQPTPISLPRDGLFASMNHSISNPVGYGGYGQDHFSDAVTDALAINLGARLDNPHPGARDFIGQGLTGIAALCLQAVGKNPVGMSPAGLFSAAHTTSDFPNLLGAGVNVALVNVYENAVSEHRAMCSIGDAPDFKKQTAISTGFFGGLVPKLEADEIKHTTITEKAEPFQLATYARMIAISREALINDNLGGLSAAIATAGNAAARTERDLVFAVLTLNKALSDGVALFHANHSNLYATGTGSPALERLGMDVAGLGVARSKMRKQKDASGGFVMTAPRFIVCPVALESAAEALIGSLTYRPDTTGEIATPSWVKTLQIIADPRLDEASELDWYLLSDPNIAPVIRLAFLNGARGPVVEQDEDFKRDVTSYKVRLDVAACAIGYFGAVKLG